MWPLWQVQFWPHGHNFNKHDSGLLGDALVLVVSGIKNLCLPLCKPM